MFVNNMNHFSQAVVAL